MQGTTQITRFGAKIVTVDPTQGLVEAILRGDQARKISVHTTPTTFRWPVVGEDWIVEQKNGSWYLEALWPPLGIAQSPVTAVTDGVSLTVNPPNVQSGGSLQVAWSNVTTPTSSDWFDTFPVGAGDSNSNYNFNWVYTSGTQNPSGPALATGTITLVAPTQPGAYEIRLSANDSDTLIASVPFSVHATTLHDVETGDAVINTPTNTVHVLGSEDGVTDFAITQNQLVAPETLRSNNAALTTTDIPSVGQGLTWQGLTGGNWVTHVGTDGYILFGWNALADVESLPTGVTESDTASRHLWATPTSDARALTNAAQTQRNATTAYANDSAGNAKDYTITFDCSSGYTGLLSVYCLDWDDSNRSQAVLINAGGVGGTHVISNFTNGAWIQEEVHVKGPLTITFKCLTGPNAVVSGIFFGGSTTQGYQPTNIIKSGDTAGGDLSGTYPNPTVAHVLGGQTPVSTSTALGGELSGTLPNPTLASSRTLLTGVAQNTNFTAVVGKINYCTGAIIGTLPSVPVVDAEVGIVALTGTVTVNRGGTDTINQLGAGSLTSISLPSGSYVVLKYLSGVWYATHIYQGFMPGDLKLSAVAAAPAGWLLCDGSPVSRTTFAALFAAVSTTYGVGDGSTTFNVPDLRGRVPVGAGTGSGLTARARGATGGEELHQLIASELPSEPFALTNNVAQAASGTSFAAVNGTFSGGDGGHNTMQPFGVVNYFVKT